MKRLVVLLFVVALVLAACGGGGEQPSAPAESGGAVTGDAARGEALFKQATIGGAPGCASCHSLQPGQKLVGPSLAGIATRAEQTIASPNYKGKAKTAEEYIRESIVDPNAYVVEGFPPNVMYGNYGKDLSAQQIADLVAFLMTLK